MVTLGIDPGIASTGYGLVEERQGKLVLLDYGVISTSPKHDARSRLGKIYADLKKIIADYRPRFVAIEKLFFGVNSKTAIAVGQARGVAILAASDNRLSLYEYPPLEVKMAITGYGRADKKQIQQMVKTLLGLSFIPKPDDAADALAIAICHIHTNSSVPTIGREGPRLMVEGG